MKRKTAKTEVKLLPKKKIALENRKCLMTHFLTSLEQFEKKSDAVKQLAFYSSYYPIVTIINTPI